MIQAKVNISGLQAKLKRIGSATPEAERAAVTLLGKAQMDFIVAVSPRDTNRFVRGFILAGNSSKVGRWSVPDLKRSRMSENLVGRLDLQVERQERKLDAADGALKFWEHRYQEWYLNKGRTRDRWARECKARLDKAKKRRDKIADNLAAARESLAQLRADPTALVVWGRKTKSDTARGRLATVRDKEYGGVGTLVSVANRTFVRYQNLEPHASIVERRHRVVARSVAILRGSGLRRAGKHFREMIKTAGHR